MTGSRRVLYFHFSAKKRSGLDKSQQPYPPPGARSFQVATGPSAVQPLQRKSACRAAGIPRNLGRGRSARLIDKQTTRPVVPLLQSHVGPVLPWARGVNQGLVFSPNCSSSATIFTKENRGRHRVLRLAGSGHGLRRNQPAGNSKPPRH